MRAERLAFALYCVGVFVLPFIGYYATLATFRVPSGEFMGSALGAWVMILTMPPFFRMAKKPMVLWQLMLVAEIVPLMGFAFGMNDVPQEARFHLARLYIDLALTPIFVYYAERIGKGFAVASEKPIFQTEESRNLIHRISPDSKPETVVNVSQK